MVLEQLVKVDFIVTHRGFTAVLTHTERHRNLAQRKVLSLRLWALLDGTIADQKGHSGITLRQEEDNMLANQSGAMC